jgi:hypothetical protein
MPSRGTVTIKICPQHTAQIAVATLIEFNCYSVKARLQKFLKFSATPAQKNFKASYPLDGITYIDVLQNFAIPQIFGRRDNIFL